MRFSSAFDVAHGKRSPWFNPLLDQDTPLYVDPFLVFDDNKALWAGAKQGVTDFFDAAARLIEQSKGNQNSLAYQKALELLRFPEPNEFCLGLSMGAPHGSGTGSKTAREMADILDLARRYGHIEDLASIAGFNLFSSGIGLDRISDILCNILKHRFIRYTQKVSRKLGITMEPVAVKAPQLGPKAIPVASRRQDRTTEVPVRRQWSSARTRAVLEGNPDGDPGRVLEVG